MYMAKYTVTFNTLPTSLEELKALPEASLKEPYYAAALCVAALCVYPTDKNACIDMLNYLKGPNPLSNYEINFIEERFRSNGDYLPASYFKGAVPSNNYAPTTPYTIEIMETPYTDAELKEGYKKFAIASGGADSPRDIKVRNKPSTGEWFLWDHQLLVGIRVPVSADPWA